MAKPRRERIFIVPRWNGLVFAFALLCVFALGFGFPSTRTLTQVLGIALVVDRLSALMLFVASVVALAVLVFATGQDQDEVRRETPVSIFHPTFLLLMAGVSNAFLAGDLFNLFVGFEILLVAASLAITWFALYALYRLITDES